MQGLWKEKLGGFNNKDIKRKKQKRKHTLRDKYVGLYFTNRRNDKKLNKDIYRAKPGITGLAQILGYDMSNPEKLALVDSIYLENESLGIKMLILLGTFFKYPRNHLANHFKIKNYR